MFQEVLQTTQEPETVDKAIKFGAIGLNILVMGLSSAAIIAVFALKSIQTAVATRVWLQANSTRFLIGGFLIVVVSALLVISPDVNSLFQALGFNVDKSPLALGVSIGLLLVGATSEPSKNPEGK